MTEPTTTSGQRDATTASPDDAASPDDTASPDEHDDGWPSIGSLLGDTGGLAPFDPPLHWPAVTAEDAASEWAELRVWVTRLTERYDMDFRTLPSCWYKHNALVEALVALRDHERACFCESASLTAGLEWQRGLRDVEARLREWTSRTGCLARHVNRRDVPADASDEDFARFVESDVTTRRHRAVEAALGDPRC